MKFKTNWLLALILAVCFLALQGCSGDNNHATGQVSYSDAALDGPWILLAGEIGIPDAYIIFDGAGNITEMGVFGQPESGDHGDYSVESDGQITGTIFTDELVPFSGQMISETEAAFYFVMAEDTVAIPVIRVEDPSACQGDWSGIFQQDSTGVNKTVDLTINSTGQIVTLTGLASPASGRFYYQSGHLTGHIYTGETNAWGEIMVTDGSNGLNGNVMSGRFGIDGEDEPEGDFELTRETPG